jgi:hypothetical protein
MIGTLHDGDRWTPERRVALEVLRLALVDFGVMQEAAPPRGGRVRYANTVSRLDASIDAGAFLLERTDPVVQFWFAVAGQSVESWRFAIWQRHPEWFQRLLGLRRVRERRTVEITNAQHAYDEVRRRLLCRARALRRPEHFRRRRDDGVPEGHLRCGTRTRSDRDTAASRGGATAVAARLARDAHRNDRDEAVTA